jgi:hypothetical protein
MGAGHRSADELRAFFLLAALGGLTAHKNPNSTASVKTLATPNAITAQGPGIDMASVPRGALLLAGEPGVELDVHQ